MATLFLGINKNVHFFASIMTKQNNNNQTVTNELVVNKMKPNIHIEKKKKGKRIK